MPRLPARFAVVVLCFALAELLLVAAILAPGRRTVTSILQIMGLSRERRFANYHRVLNRAACSGQTAARVLLGLLLDAFLPTGPVLLGLDDTIERRHGKRITPKGSIVTRSAPAMATSSRPAGCAGSALCSWCRSPGPGGWCN